MTGLVLGVGFALTIGLDFSAALTGIVGLTVGAGLVLTTAFVLVVGCFATTGLALSFILTAGIGVIGLTVVAGLAAATDLVVVIALAFVAGLTFAVTFTLGAGLALATGFTGATDLATGAGLTAIAGVVLAFTGGVLLVDRSVIAVDFCPSAAALLTFDVALFTSPPNFLEFGTVVLSPKLGVAVSNATPMATVRLWIHCCFMTEQPRYFQITRAKPIEPGNTPGAPNPPYKKFAPQLEIGIGNNCVPFRS